MARFNKRLTKDLKREILVRARAKLARRGGWVKGFWARRDDAGQPQFCIVGAINRAAQEVGLRYQDGRWIDRTDARVVQAISLDSFTGPFAAEVLGRLNADGMPFKYAMTFNDDKRTRKKDVLALLDAYIEELS